LVLSKKRASWLTQAKLKAVAERGINRAVEQPLLIQIQFAVAATVQQHAESLQEQHLRLAGQLGIRVPDYLIVAIALELGAIRRRHQG
jgi:hypothetical protein